MQKTTRNLKFTNLIKLFSSDDKSDLASFKRAIPVLTGFLDYQVMTSTSKSISDMDKNITKSLSNRDIDLLSLSDNTFKSLFNIIKEFDKSTKFSTMTTTLEENKLSLDGIEETSKLYYSLFNEYNEGKEQLKKLSLSSNENIDLLRRQEEIENDLFNIETFFKVLGKASFDFIKDYNYSNFHSNEDLTFPQELASLYSNLKANKDIKSDLDRVVSIVLSFYKDNGLLKFSLNKRLNDSSNLENKYEISKTLSRVEDIKSENDAIVTNLIESANNKDLQSFYIGLSKFFVKLSSVYFYKKEDINSINSDVDKASKTSSYKKLKDELTKKHDDIIKCQNKLSYFCKKFDLDFNLKGLDFEAHLNGDTYSVKNIIAFVNELGNLDIYDLKNSLNTNTFEEILIEPIRKLYIDSESKEDKDNLNNIIKSFSKEDNIYAYIKDLLKASYLKNKRDIFINQRKTLFSPKLVDKYLNQDGSDRLLETSFEPMIRSLLSAFKGDNVHKDSLNHTATLNVLLGLDVDSSDSGRETRTLGESIKEFSKGYSISKNIIEFSKSASLLGEKVKNSEKYSYDYSLCESFLNSIAAAEKILTGITTNKNNKDEELPQAIDLVEEAIKYNLVTNRYTSTGVTNSTSVKSLREEFIEAFIKLQSKHSKVTKSLLSDKKRLEDKIAKLQESVFPAEFSESKNILKELKLDSYSKEEKLNLENRLKELKSKMSLKSHLVLSDAKDELRKALSDLEILNRQIEDSSRDILNIEKDITKIKVSEFTDFVKDLKKEFNNLNQYNTIKSLIEFKDKNAIDSLTSSLSGVINPLLSSPNTFGIVRAVSYFLERENYNKKDFSDYVELVTGILDTGMQRGYSDLDMASLMDLSAEDKLYMSYYNSLNSGLNRNMGEVLNPSSLVSNLKDFENKYKSFNLMHSSILKDIDLSNSLFQFSNSINSLELDKDSAVLESELKNKFSNSFKSDLNSLSSKNSKLSELESVELPKLESKYRSSLRDYKSYKEFVDFFHNREKEDLQHKLEMLSDIPALQVRLDSLNSQLNSSQRDLDTFLEEKERLSLDKNKLEEQKIKYEIEFNNLTSLKGDSADLDPNLSKKLRILPNRIESISIEIDSISDKLSSTYPDDVLSEKSEKVESYKTRIEKINTLIQDPDAKKTSLRLKLKKLNDKLKFYKESILPKYENILFLEDGLEDKYNKLISEISDLKLDISKEESNLDKEYFNNVTKPLLEKKNSFEIEDSGSYVKTLENILKEHGLEFNNNDKFNLLNSLVSVDLPEGSYINNYFSTFSNSDNLDLISKDYFLTAYLRKSIQTEFKRLENVDLKQQGRPQTSNSPANYVSYETLLEETVSDTYGTEDQGLGYTDQDEFLENYDKTVLNDFGAVDTFNIDDEVTDKARNAVDKVINSLNDTLSDFADKTFIKTFISDKKIEEAVSKVKKETLSSKFHTSVDEIISNKRAFYSGLQKSGLDVLFRTQGHLNKIIGDTAYRKFSKDILSSETNFVKSDPIKVVLQYYILPFLELWSNSELGPHVEVKKDFSKTLDTNYYNLILEDLKNDSQISDDVKNRLSDLVSGYLSNVITNVTDIDKFESFISASVFKKADFMKSVGLLFLPYLSTVKAHNGKLYWSNNKLLLNSLKSPKTLDGNPTDLSTFLDIYKNEKVESQIFLASPRSKNTYIVELDFSRGFTFSANNVLWREIKNYMRTKNSNILKKSLEVVSPLFKEYLLGLRKGVSSYINIDDILDFSKTLDLSKYNVNRVSRDRARDKYNSMEKLRSKLPNLDFLHKTMKYNPSEFYSNKDNVRKYDSLLKQFSEYYTFTDYDDLIKELSKDINKWSNPVALEKLDKLESNFLDNFSTLNVSLNRAKKFEFDNLYKDAFDPMLDRGIKNYEDNSRLKKLRDSLDILKSRMALSKLVEDRSYYTNIASGDFNLEQLVNFLRDINSGYFLDIDNLISMSKKLTTDENDQLYTILSSYVESVLNLSDKDKKDKFKNVLVKGLNTFNSHISNLKLKLNSNNLTSYAKLKFNPYKLYNTMEQIKLEIKSVMRVRNELLSEFSNYNEVELPSDVLSKVKNLRVDTIFSKYIEISRNVQKDKLYITEYLGLDLNDSEELAANRNDSEIRPHIERLELNTSNLKELKAMLSDAISKFESPESIKGYLTSRVVKEDLNNTLNSLKKKYLNYLEMKKGLFKLIEDEKSSILQMFPEMSDRELWVTSLNNLNSSYNQELKKLETAQNTFDFLKQNGSKLKNILDAEKDSDVYIPLIENVKGLCESTELSSLGDGSLKNKYETFLDKFSLDTEFIEKFNLNLKSKLESFNTNSEAVLNSYRKNQVVDKELVSVLTTSSKDLFKIVKDINSLEKVFDSVYERVMGSKGDYSNLFGDVKDMSLSGSEVILNKVNSIINSSLIKLNPILKLVEKKAIFGDFVNLNSGKNVDVSEDKKAYDNLLIKEPMFILIEDLIDNEDYLSAFNFYIKNMDVLKLDRKRLDSVKLSFKIFCNSIYDKFELAITSVKDIDSFEKSLSDKRKKLVVARASLNKELRKSDMSLDYALENDNEKVKALFDKVSSLKTEIKNLIDLQPENVESLKDSISLYQNILKVFLKEDQVASLGLSKNYKGILKYKKFELLQSRNKLI